MQKLEAIKNTLSPRYGIVMLIASGLGTHAYYSNYRYAAIKRQIYSKLFTEENINATPLLKVRTYEDLNGIVIDVPDDGEGRYSELLSFQDKSILFLQHELKETLVKNTMQTIFLSLVSGLFFPIGTSILLSTNIIARTRLIQQSNKTLEQGAETPTALLEKRKEIFNVFSDIKDFSELGIALLIPLIASKSFFTKL